MNPLLAAAETPFELPPFDRIADADFAPAFAAALEEARANVAAIAADPAPADFANTIEALELAEQALERVLGVFFNLASADSNPRREELQRDFSQRLATWAAEVSGNRALFARIEALWARREELARPPEAARVLFLTRRRFLRQGAALSEDRQARLKAIRERLAALQSDFARNVLAAERAWALDLDEAALAPLPGFLQDALRAAGAERGHAGAVVTLSRSLIVPFLQFSPDRALRRRAYEAWVSRGEGDDGTPDNRPLAAEILALRAELAQLLGHASFAEYKLETEMARDPAAVRKLLMQVWEPARRAALADAERLQARMQADGVNGPLEPWDWRYYAEARRREELELDEAEIKPYLPLERMIAAAFDCATRLFGLEFRPLDVPLYHADARAWEVRREGRHLAVFIGDYFARSSKRSGAWCSAFREQQKLAGEVRPVVVNVCNFVKPPAGQPALLSWDDARTLFHEFGHALHQMLSDVTYPSISGTSVARDFVELPSQLYEHWLSVPEVLERHARHAGTGAPMPAELRERLIAAETYDMGFQTVEYLASALVDLAFHEGAAPADPMTLQAEVLERLGMPHAIRMRHATPHFAHVFSGDGYSAGYYSYMWSEVMDADAFDAFREAGSAFDSATAARLAETILSKGGSEEADALYLRFRGRMPSVEPLLRGRGLAEDAQNGEARSGEARAGEVQTREAPAGKAQG